MAYYRKTGEFDPLKQYVRVSYTKKKNNNNNHFIYTSVIVAL